MIHFSWRVRSTDYFAGTAGISHTTSTYWSFLQRYRRCRLISQARTLTHQRGSKSTSGFVLFFVLDIFSNRARPGPGPHDCPPWSDWPQQVQHGEVWKSYPEKHTSKTLFMETHGCNYSLFLSGTKRLWNTRRLITLSTYQWLLQCTLWVCLNCTCIKQRHGLGRNSIKEWSQSQAISVHLP